MLNRPIFPACRYIVQKKKSAKKNSIFARFIPFFQQFITSRSEKLEAF
jgi:hypothetical protein